MGYNDDKKALHLVLADPDKDKAVYLELGFAPGKVEIQNISDADLAKIEWNSKQTGVSAAAGGILTDKISGGAVTREAVVAGSGIEPYDGGNRIRYNVAATPTYKDEDDTSFTDLIYDVTEGTAQDVLARELPAKSADDGAIYHRKQGIKINTNAKLRPTTGNSLVITIHKE